jgi:D-alanine transaminase
MNLMNVAALVDGKLIDIDENVTPMEDRGYQFGDGVYEVTRVYNGQCFMFKPHMNRLFRSLAELKIDFPYSCDDLQGFHELLIKESGIMEGTIYLQVTRGVAPREHGFPKKISSRLTMFARPLKDKSMLRKVGSKGIFVPDIRWLRCDIKSLNLLGNVMAKEKASQAGCYEAIQFRESGVVTEGSSSNFWAVKDQILYTHPATNLILKGIARTLIFERLAPQLGIAVVEREFDRNFIFGCDETFVCGTTTEIMPIIQIDDKKIGDGAVGAVSKKLQIAYLKAIQEECYS